MEGWQDLSPEEHLRARGESIWQDAGGRLRGGDPLNFNVSSLRRIAPRTLLGLPRRAHVPETKFLEELPVNEFRWKSLMAVLLAYGAKWDSDGTEAGLGKFESMYELRVVVEYH